MPEQIAPGALARVMARTWVEWQREAEHGHQAAAKERAEEYRALQALTTRPASVTREHIDVVAHQLDAALVAMLDAVTHLTDDDDAEFQAAIDRAMNALQVGRAVLHE
jgi:hypothetical protein